MKDSVVLGCGDGLDTHLRDSGVGEVGVPGVGRGSTPLIVGAEVPPPGVGRGSTPSKVGDAVIVGLGVMVGAGEEVGL